MSNLNKPVEQLVTELADTVASLTQYMNTEDILCTLDDIAEKMKIRCEADPSTYGADQYWWRNLKAISQWVMNRQRYTLVADDFGDPYLIHEGMEDDWLAFLKEPVGPLPEWAMGVDGKDISFYLQ